MAVLQPRLRTSCFAAPMRVKKDRYGRHRHNAQRKRQEEDNKKVKSNRQRRRLIPTARTVSLPRGSSRRQLRCPASWQLRPSHSTLMIPRKKASSRHVPSKHRSQTRQSVGHTNKTEITIDSTRKSFSPNHQRTGTCQYFVDICLLSVAAVKPGCSPGVSGCRPLAGRLGS